MKRTVKIYPFPIQMTSSENHSALDPQCGSVIEFRGHVRGDEAGSKITGIHYQAFEDMAHRQFELILDVVENTWPIEEIVIHHVFGKVPVGEPSIWVKVISGHRKEGFEAIQFVLSQMKIKVPIWKAPIKS